MFFSRSIFVIGLKKVSTWEVLTTEPREELSTKGTTKIFASISDIPNKIDSIPLDSLDLNIVVAYILNQAKARILLKNISIKINFPPQLSFINSSESLLVKACSLFLLYIIDQNSNNAEINITIIQKNNKTTINIKDSAKQPILSDEDLRVKYDVILALNIFKKLNIQLDYSYKNKLQRDISIIVNS
jgi:hypothetical protein